MRSWPRPRLTIGVSCGSGTKVVRAGLTMRRRELGGAHGRSKPAGHGLGLTGRFPMRVSLAREGPSR
jgi:hypothetical protein